MRQLISAGAAWRCLDNGSTQGTTWRNPDFNDSAWSNGVAQFRYGSGAKHDLLRATAVTKPTYQLAANAAYKTLASAAQSPNLEDSWFSYPINPALLADGTNTLAVEIHDDRDPTFDLQLEAQ